MLESDSLDILAVIRPWSLQLYYWWNMEITNRLDSSTDRQMLCGLNKQIKIAITCFYLWHKDYITIFNHVIFLLNREASHTLKTTNRITKNSSLFLHVLHTLITMFVYMYMLIKDFIIRKRCKWAISITKTQTTAGYNLFFLCFFLQIWTQYKKLKAHMFRWTERLWRCRNDRPLILSLVFGFYWPLN